MALLDIVRRQVRRFVLGNKPSVSRLSELQPGRYRHFKGGEYKVQGVARHSETGEELVVYRPLYDEGGLWVRLLAMFQELVVREGKEQSRF